MLEPEREPKKTLGFDDILSRDIMYLPVLGFWIEQWWWLVRGQQPNNLKWKEKQDKGETKMRQKKPNEAAADGDTKKTQAKTKTMSRQDRTKDTNDPPNKAEADGVLADLGAGAGPGCMPMLPIPPNQTKEERRVGGQGRG